MSTEHPCKGGTAGKPATCHDTPVQRAHDLRPCPVCNSAENIYLHMTYEYDWLACHGCKDQSVWVTAETSALWNEAADALRGALGASA